MNTRELQRQVSQRPVSPISEHRSVRSPGGPPAQQHPTVAAPGLQEASLTNTRQLECQVSWRPASIATRIPDSVSARSPEGPPCQYQTVSAPGLREARHTNTRSLNVRKQCAGGRERSRTSCRCDRTSENDARGRSNIRRRSKAPHRHYRTLANVGRFWTRDNAAVRNSAQALQEHFFCRVPFQGGDSSKQGNFYCGCCHVRCCCCCYCWCGCCCCCCFVVVVVECWCC